MHPSLLCHPRRFHAYHGQDAGDAIARAFRRSAAWPATRSSHFPCAIGYPIRLGDPLVAAWRCELK
jgi:hypothetical protein